MLQRCPENKQIIFPKHKGTRFFGTELISAKISSFIYSFYEHEMQKLPFSVNPDSYRNCNICQNNCYNWFAYHSALVEIQNPQLSWTLLCHDLLPLNVAKQERGGDRIKSFLRQSVASSCPTPFGISFSKQEKKCVYSNTASAHKSLLAGATVLLHNVLAVTCKRCEGALQGQDNWSVFTD